ncbi:MAG: DUF692 domain-containing protein [Pseudomonadota bacterium]|nr:DUF692 domain-containing protein [Pseudomonadota bacterium]
MSVASRESIATCPPGSAALACRAGLGFKYPHFDALLADPDPPGFIEVHAENYMGAGGVPHAQLTRIRERLPISLHGVGLSIGGEEAPDPAHLDRLAALIVRYQPALFSEHLAWSTHGGTFFNDLLPLSYDATTLQRVCDHIGLVQERLGTRMLLENPSSYFEFESSSFSEPDFISEVVLRTGCALLLDLNNVHVSCHNNGHDPLAYLAALPLSAVRQIHLAGHAQEMVGNAGSLLIDNHGAPVADPVWDLYSRTLSRTGPVATLIEWDNDVPEYAVLRAEAARADRVVDRVCQSAAALAG